jgi:hypothetical protein
MKISEFRKLIREEITKVIKEDTLSDKVLSLGYSEDKEKDYKVGKGKRRGMEINPDKLKSILSTAAVKNIDSLINSGVTFKKAYVTIRKQDDYGTPKSVIMYSFIGDDTNGNEIIYDKYEGNVPGFGQTYVFVNGQKQNATKYLSSKSVGMPDTSDSKKFFSKMGGTKDVSIDSLRNSKVDIWFVDGTKDGLEGDEQLKVMNKIYNTLLKNKSVLSNYFQQHSLPASKVVFAKYGGSSYTFYEVNITSNKALVNKNKGRSVINSFDI